MRKKNEKKENKIFAKAGIRRKDRKRIKFKELITAQLPSAISSRINPLILIGCIMLLIAIVLAARASSRGAAPMLLLMSALMLGYALWQKAEVLKNGYDEYVFKVVDYTCLVPFAEKVTGPMGMVLLNKTDPDIEDGNLYHVAVSGKGKTLPPIDWLVRVYVPKGSIPAQYGDMKYFPTVYGYALEGEDNTGNYADMRDNTNNSNNKGEREND